MRHNRKWMAVVLGFAPAVALLWSLGGLLTLAAAPGEITHAAASVLHVCPAGCTYSTIQAAVDAAAPGDTIKVAAGTYSGVETRASMNTGTFTATQLVAITKSVNIEGGYTPSNWDVSNPDANLTTLDAQGLGRVMVISGTIHVGLVGLRITGGNATSLGGFARDSDCGGGLYVSGATVGIADSSIYSNTAYGDPMGWGVGFGGGVYLDKAVGSELKGNVIAHNAGSRQGHGHGGGIYARQSNGLALAANVIEGNTGTLNGNGEGAGLEVSDCDHLVMDGNTVRGNVGSEGANFYGGGAYIAYCSDAIITSNTIAENLAGAAWSWGGGLYLYGLSRASVGGNEFRANTASLHRGWGGGLYVSSCTDMSLGGNRFVRNAGTSNPAALSWGGGAEVAASSAITLTNNVFLANQVTAAGSALAITNSAVLLQHTTFAGNHGGDGSGMQVAARSSPGSTANLVNTIWFNQVVAIAAAQGSTVTLEATLWEAVPTGWMGEGWVSATGNYAGDPRFASDGYHLRAGSAALDKGVDAGVPVDIEGDARPGGAGYDLGADEFWPRAYLPVVVRRQTY